MKKLTFSLAVVAILMMTAACGNKAELLQQKVDSLQTALHERNGDFDRLNEFLLVVSDGLDSIAVQENGLLVRNPESPLPSRAEMKKGLQNLKETLKEQRERIASMENELANSKGDVRRLKGLINALKQQIEQKDAQISELLLQLEQSNISIEQLTTRVGSLTQQNVQQEVKIAEQEEVLVQQDQLLNEGYVKVGSKKELKAAGLLVGGGLFSKKKVDMSAIDKSVFQKVDIRQVTEIPIASKKPKLLTPAPADSYHFETEGNTSTLIIDNPTRFWSVSSFLIVQE
jgi:hypothetical protein